MAASAMAIYGRLVKGVQTENAMQASGGASAQLPEQPRQLDDGGEDDGHIAR